jgi:hypothetical protein
VIVRLDDPEHGPLVGKWFLEWSYLDFLSGETLFGSPEEAAAWVAGRAA